MIEPITWGLIVPEASLHVVVYSMNVLVVATLVNYYLHVPFFESQWLGSRSPDGSCPPGS